MSIQNELLRITQAKEALKGEIEARGGDLSGKRIDEYAPVLASLPASGAGGAVKEIPSEAAMEAAMAADEPGTFYSYVGPDTEQLLSGSVYLLLEAIEGPMEGKGLTAGERSLLSVTPGILFPDTTYYTEEQIAACDYTNDFGQTLHLYGWGQTKDSYVVGAFSEDYSLLTLTRNGDDSDGIMRTMELSGTLRDLFKANVRRILTGKGLRGTLTELSKAKGLRTLLIAPNSFDALCDYCFASSGFTELLLPEGIRMLGRASLQSCTSLTHLSLPSTFEGFTDFQALTFDSALTSITYRGTVAQLSALVNEDTWSCAEMGTNLIHCLDGDYTVACWRLAT